MYIKDHDKTALIYGDEEVSYKKLVDKIDDYSSHFKIMKK
jgi:hypothetical protein